MNECSQGAYDQNARSVENDRTFCTR